MEKQNSKRFVLEMIILGLIIAAVVFVFITTQPEEKLAAAAVNARVPLGQVFKELIDAKFGIKLF